MKLTAIKQLREFLIANHPTNLLMPCNQKKEPMCAHKNDQWSWNKFDNFVDSVMIDKYDVAILLRTMIVLDFDDLQLAKQWEDCFSEMTNCPVQKTQKGYHYFFLRSQLCDELKVYDKSRALKDFDGSVLEIDVKTVCSTGTAGCIMAYPSSNKVWVEGKALWDTPIPEITDELVRAIAPPVCHKKCIKNGSKPNTTSFDVLSKVVQNLSPSRADDYNNWYKVVASIARTGKTNNYVNQALELAHNFSHNSGRKYDSMAVQKKFQHFLENNGEEGVSFGSLVHWLKEDNPKAHSEMFGDNRGGDHKSYTEVKKELETQVFKVLNPYLFCREVDDKELQMMDRQTLKGIYENLWYWKYDQRTEKLVAEPFVTDWLTDADARTYEKVDFLPPPHLCPEGVYNLFNGLRASKLEHHVNVEGLEAVKHHVHRMSGGDDKCYDYVIKWLALKVQRPGELPRVALIFQSEQGSGKNLFWDFYGKKVLGCNYYFLTPDINHLLGRFAEGLKHRLCIVLDETSGKDTFQRNELIKAQITSETIHYERKFCPSTPFTNCCAWVFITNNEIPVKIEYSDRRFILLEGLNDRLNDPSYFDPLIKYLNDDGVARAFYDYLMSIDISDFNPVTQRPMTEAYQAVKEASTPTVARFVKDYIDQMKSDEEVVDSKELFASFNTWCEDNKSKSDMNNVSFGIHLKKWLNNSKDEKKPRTGKAQKVKINKHNVIANFRRKKIFVSQFGDTEPF
jgi:hypothetical protein